MVEKISNYILNKMKKKDKTIEGESEEVLLFGITRIIEEIPKTIGAIIVCICFGIIKEAAILFVVNAIYKTFVGGVHAKTNFGCFFTGLVLIFTVVYTSKFLVLEGMLMYIVYGLIYLFSLYIIYKYAPADTMEIPIINKELRKKIKIKAFIALNVIYILSLIFIKDIVFLNIIMLTILGLDIMTTRPLYKLFKSKYGHEEYNENLELIKSNI